MSKKRPFLGPPAINVQKRPFLEPPAINVQKRPFLGGRRPPLLDGISVFLCNFLILNQIYLTDYGLEYNLHILDIPRFYYTYVLISLF